MQTCVLFIQGAGQGAYVEDRLLAASLQRALGADYDVQYPQMPDEDDPQYQLWRTEIETRCAALTGDVVLVGHSVGGSIVLKALSQSRSKSRIAGLYVIAAPFWGGEGWLYEGYETLQLPRNVAAKLDGTWPIFFYHGRDDDIVPFAHLALYAARLPRATIRVVDGGGHQFNNDLTDVARDIRKLRSS